MALESGNYKNMQFLSVNPEDYFIDGHRRRSVVLPGLGTTSASAMDVRTSSPMPSRRTSNSSRDIARLDNNGNLSASLASLASSFNKSTESLCFGIGRKKLQRLQRRDSSIYRPRCYTEPAAAEKQMDVDSTSIVPRQKSSSIQHESLTLAATHGQQRENVWRSHVQQTAQVTSALIGLNGSSEHGLQVGQTTLINDEKSVKQNISRCTHDYSFAERPSNSSVAVQANGHVHNTDAKRFNCLDAKGNKSSSAQQLQKPHHRQHHQHSSSALSGSEIPTTTTRTLSSGSCKYPAASSTDSKSLKQGAQTAANFPLAASASTTSVRSKSPSKKSNGSITAKHERSSSAAAAAATVTAATAGGVAAAAAPTDKEKKRKEVSGSRLKKFHRHFTQVSKDEKLINYFSCALVSDILLQGHLYITDQHFAFYSNVFGYVTKVVIPTSSVTKISKEKTAKIIPNAVGVATADERHVFGSFISREAAFRLMCSVCPPLAPVELLPKTPADVLEYSEEMSIEDDSSCSISGNESPPQLAAPVNSSEQTLLRRNVTGSNGNTSAGDKLFRHSDNPNTDNSIHASITSAARTSAPPTAHFNNIISNSENTKDTNHSCAPSRNATNHNNNDVDISSLNTLLNTQMSTGAAGSAAAAAAPAEGISMIIAGTTSSTSASTSSTPSPSSVSSTSLPTIVLNGPKTAAQAAAISFKTLSKNVLLRLQFPKQLHIVYLGVVLSVLLALFSGFLLYRILDIEAKTNLYFRGPLVNWGTVNDDDIFTEALRWQKELQTKSTEEAQSILNSNLEQIAKVRRSLETLSMLILDRNSARNSAKANAAASHKCDESD